jgi:hypothetical protein
MKKLIVCFTLFCTSAFAQVAPIDVASECVRQMAMGICMATPDRSTPGQTMLIAGVGRVQYSAYIDYMDLYNPALPSDPAMCDLALTYMETAPGSDHDKVARALWTPPPEAESKVNIAELAIKAAMGAGVASIALFIIRRRKVEA